MSKLGGLLSSPQSAGVLGLAQGLLASAGPHLLTPVSLSQAVAQGLQSSQAMQKSALANQQADLQNKLQKMMFPYQRARIATILGSLDDGTQPAQPASQAPTGLLQGASLALPGVPGAVQDAYAPTSGIPSAPTAQMVQTARTQAQGNPTVMSGLLADPQWRKGFSLSLFGIPTGTTLMQEAFQAATADNPSLQGQIAGAKANAALPANLVENMARYAARPTALAPGESAVSGFSMFPKAVQAGLLGEISSALNGSQGAPGQPGVAVNTQQSAGVPVPAIPAVAAAVRSSSGGVGDANMAGAPNGPLTRTSSDGSFPVMTGQSPYSVQLQKDLASQDAETLKTVNTDAQTAAQSQNNIEEMWQAYQNGLPAGNLAHFQNAIASTFNSLGLTPDSKLIDNYTSMNKNSMQLGMQLTRTLSSRPSQLEFQQISRAAIPNPSLQPGALGYLLGQMQGINQYLVGRSNYVTAAAARGVNPRAATNAFNTNASATPLTFAALRDNDPAYYGRLVAQLKKTATGRAMYDRVNKELVWMMQNGVVNARGELVRPGVQ